MFWTALAGNDTLDDGAGNDTLRGGAGDDTWVVDTPGDSVIENPQQGQDTVRTALNGYTLPANVEDLLLGGDGDDLLDGDAVECQLSEPRRTKLRQSRHDPDGQRDH